MANKADLVTRIAANSGTSQAEAGVAFDAVLDAIYDELAAGHDVNLPKFGKFTLVQREARVGRNPATGESVDIAARTAVKFKPSSTLKDVVADVAVTA